MADGTCSRPTRRSCLLHPRRRDELAVCRERRTGEGVAIWTPKIAHPIGDAHGRVPEALDREAPSTTTDVLQRTFGEMIGAIAFRLSAFVRRQWTVGRIERPPEPP